MEIDTAAQKLDFRNFFCQILDDGYRSNIAYNILLFLLFSVFCEIA